MLNALRKVLNCENSPERTEFEDMNIIVLNFQPLKGCGFGTFLEHRFHRR